MSTPIKAKPIQTNLGRLYPAISNDTLNGQKLTAGSVFMGSHAATAVVTHAGEEYEIDILLSLGGTLVIQGERAFVVDVKAVINHAIEHGLLKESLDFKEAADPEPAKAA